jgi:hypothetical protein
MSKQTPINLFINQSEIDSMVLTKPDQSTAYIINQNNHLLQEFLDITNRITLLINEKEELEEYSSRLEKTKTCLQGYVHNEHFVAKRISEVSIVYINLLKISSVLLFVNLFLMVFTFNFTLILIPLTSVLTHAYFIVINRDHINKLLQDIKKSQESNTYLDDLIDNI